MNARERNYNRDTLRDDAVGVDRRSRAVSPLERCAGVETWTTTSSMRRINPVGTHPTARPMVHLVRRISVECKADVASGQKHLRGDRKRALCICSSYCGFIPIFVGVAARCRILGVGHFHLG